MSTYAAPSLSTIRVASLNARRWRAAFATGPKLKAIVWDSAMLYVRRSNAYAGHGRYRDGFDPEEGRYVG